jgi:hypothetical protein
LGAAILGTGDVSGEHIKGYQRNPYTEVRAILSPCPELTLSYSELLSD